MTHLPCPLHLPYTLACQGRGGGVFGKNSTFGPDYSLWPICYVGFFILFGHTLLFFFWNCFFGIFLEYFWNQNVSHIAKVLFCYTWTPKQRTEIKIAFWGLFSHIHFTFHVPLSSAKTPSVTGFCRGAHLCNSPHPATDEAALRRRRAGHRRGSGHPRHPHLHRRAAGPPGGHGPSPLRLPRRGPSHRPHLHQQSLMWLLPPPHPTSSSHHLSPSPSVSPSDRCPCGVDLHRGIPS